MSKKYTIHSDKFKFKVALEALKELKPIHELCQEFGVAPSQIYAWKKKLKEVGAQTFSSNRASNESREQEIERLHAAIGKLKVECDFLAKVLGR